MTVSMTAPPQEIEWTADRVAMRAMITKIAAAWEAYGAVAPYHSVLSSDEYVPERFDENRISFFGSAKDDLELILGLLCRIGRSPSDFTRCLEFGCGVGRVTAQLATTFSEVVAVDVSYPHLQLAKEYIQELGHQNVSFLQATPDDLHPRTKYDLWFSRLVLQHNPAPVTLEILNKMFTGLSVGGVAIFHVPTYQNGYYFKIIDYLRDSLPPENMHMHVTPQKPILELAWRHDCVLLDIREELAPGWVINVFVFQKAKTSLALMKRLRGALPALIADFRRSRPIFGRTIPVRRSG